MKWAVQMSALISSSFVVGFSKCLWKYSFINLPSPLRPEDGGAECIQKSTATSWAGMAARITAQSVFEMFASVVEWAAFYFQRHLGFVLNSRLVAGSPVCWKQVFQVDSLLFVPCVEMRGAGQGHLVLVQFLQHLHCPGIGAPTVTFRDGEGACHLHTSVR